MSNVRTVAMSILSLVILSGCATGPTLSEPKAVIGAKAERGSVIQVAVDIQNPGDEPLPLRFVEYSVDVVGQPALSFKGVRSAEATLPAKGSHRLVLPASFPSGADLTGAKFRVSGSVGYIEPGQVAKVLYEYGLSRPSVGFSGAGTVVAGG